MVQMEDESNRAAIPFAASRLLARPFSRPAHRGPSPQTFEGSVFRNLRRMILHARVTRREGKEPNSRDACQDKVYFRHMRCVCVSLQPHFHAAAKRSEHPLPASRSPPPCSSNLPGCSFSLLWIYAGLWKILWRRGSFASAGLRGPGRRVLFVWRSPRAFRLKKAIQCLTGLDA